MQSNLIIFDLQIFIKKKKNFSLQKFFIKTFLPPYFFFLLIFNIKK